MNRPGSASAWGGQHGHLGNLRLLHAAEVFRAIRRAKREASPLSALTPSKAGRWRRSLRLS